MSRKRSKKGFWGFLRPQKTRLPASEASDAGAPVGEQDACQPPKDDSFDALFAYLDEERRDAELEFSTGPPEALEQTKDRESPPSAWEISEEEEARVSEAPDRESPEEANIPETEFAKRRSLEEVETQGPEAPERKSLGGAAPPELGECPSVPGMALEKLRVLEDQLVSLESCIAERLHSHR